MMKCFYSVLYSILFLCTAHIMTGPALSQDKFPSEPIKIVVGFSAGGGFDTAARAIARAAGEAGVTIVVENMKGAGGRRAISHTERSRPDGHTLVLANMPMQLFYNMLGKDKFKLDEFAFVARVVTQDPLVLVSKESPIKSIEGLKSLERFRLCIGGMAGHDGLTSVVLQKVVGYKPPQMVTNYVSERAIPGLARGDCDLALGVSNPLWTDAVKSNRLRVLAVFAPEKNQAFPNAPTFKELGYPELSSPALVNHGVLAGPPGTPRNVIETLEGIVIKAVNDPSTRKILETNGMSPAPLPAQGVKELVREMKGLVDKYGPLIAPHVR